MFFLMYKYGCLYVYQRFIMLDKGMKSILKFGQQQMDVANLINRNYSAILATLQITSYVHSTVIKGEVLHEPKKLRYYRSYKTFDIENFNNDIEQIKINQTMS